VSECGLDCVYEDQCVRDAVEGQSSCTAIHTHSYSVIHTHSCCTVIHTHSCSTADDGLYREFSLYVIVFE